MHVAQVPDKLTRYMRVPRTANRSVCAPPHCACLVLHVAQIRDKLIRTRVYLEAVLSKHEPDVDVADTMFNKDEMEYALRQIYWWVAVANEQKEGLPDSA